MALGFCIWLLWPAESMARSVIRFVHALPGVGATTIEVSQGGFELRTGAIRFGQVTPWRGLRSGRFHWMMVAEHQTLAQGDATVRPGAYDAVLLARSSGASLGLFRARAGRPGTGLLRVIQAAPELGAPDLELDSNVVASTLSFAHATPYLPVAPGVHSLSAVRAAGSAPLVSLAGLRLASGRAYSAVLLGSRGQRLRWVTVTDRGAPLTRRGARGTGASPGTVIVDRGDSLWSIARARLGPSASNEAVYREVLAIWAINARRIGTGDPNLIFPGQRIVLPD